jgi:hypothetical protein
MSWVTDRKDERKSRQCQCKYCDGKEPLNPPPRIFKTLGFKGRDPEKNFKRLAMRIGTMVLNLPRASAQAGHVGPWGTLHDYIRPDPRKDPELHEAAEFLKDITCLTTEQMMHKWFGDPMEDLGKEEGDDRDEPLPPRESGSVHFPDIPPDPDVEKAGPAARASPREIAAAQKRLAAARKKRLAAERRRRLEAKRSKTSVPASTPYCDDFSSNRRCRFRAICDGLCVLHLSRREAQKAAERQP